MAGILRCPYGWERSRSGWLLLMITREKPPTFGLVDRLTPISMAGGAFGGGVIENDQAVDGDAGFGVDQEWIDVDRGDAGAGVRHQVGQADQRLDGGSLVPR